MKYLDRAIVMDMGKMCMMNIMCNFYHALPAGRSRG